MKAFTQRSAPTLVLAVLLAVSVRADTLYFGQSSTFSPLPNITAVTTFTSPPAGKVYETVNETTISSTPCDLEAGGCSLGTFSIQLPSVVLPPDQQIENAQLEVFIRPNLSTTVSISTTPINPKLPYTTSDLGTIYRLNYGSFTTAIGAYGAGGGAPDFDEVGLEADYTIPVISALQTGTALQPVTAEDTINYFFKGGPSIVPEGLNSVTTVVTNFDGNESTVNALAVLTVTTTPVPEVNSWLFVVIGFLFVFRKEKAKLKAGMHLP